MGTTQIEGQLPIVAVLSTGGTIASEQNHLKGATKQSSQAKI
jgi:L-asparaginase/Glu-tRNA(Gln) amidotransferase subunit D